MSFLPSTLEQSFTVVFCSGWNRTWPLVFLRFLSTVL